MRQVNFLLNTLVRGKEKVSVGFNIHKGGGCEYHEVLFLQ